MARTGRPTSPDTLALRDRISEFLRTHQVAGISCVAMAKAFGMPPSTLKWHLNNFPDAHLAKTKSMPAQRWFHADNWADADAYVALVDGRQRKALRIGPASEAAMRAAVESSGESGIGTKALAAAAGLATSTVQMFGRAVGIAAGWTIVPHRGQFESMYYPAGVTPPPPRERKPKQRSKPKPKPEKPVKALKLKAAKKPVNLFGVAPSGPAIIPDGLQITVCPSGQDMRFRVANPEPLFSSQPPGRYTMHSGSAIERAYAGR